MASNKVNLIGKIFGYLVVTEKAPPTPRANGSSRGMYTCACRCGVALNINTTHLQRGQIVSCGCRKLEGTARTHGASHTKAWRAYYHMISRCYNPKNRSYKWYGGRGIVVCGRWLRGVEGMSGLECFLLDMGDPLVGTSLDRKDNNKEYSKANCRWVSQATQLRNTRRSIPTPYGCLLDAAAKFDMPYSIARYHMGKGKTFDEVVALWRKKQPRHHKGV